MSSFAEKIQDLCGRAERNNVWRQKESFNLIPSESTPSLLVKMCEISDPAGRYASTGRMKGEEIYFYQGIDFIRDVEAEAQRELARFFECSDVELRPISGQMANEVVFKGLTKFINRGRRRAGVAADAPRPEQRPEQRRPSERPAHGRPLQLDRRRSGDRQGKRRPFPGPPGQSVQGRSQRLGRSFGPAQARADRLRQKHCSSARNRSSSWPISSRTGPAGRC